MSRKKQTFTADFKYKVVFEVLESDLTLNEVTSKHKILPRNLQNWKSQFMANMSLAFESKNATKSDEGTIENLQNENDQLAKKLGKTIIERDCSEGGLSSKGNPLLHIPRIYREKDPISSEEKEQCSRLCERERPPKQRPFRRIYAAFDKSFHHF